MRKLFLPLFILLSITTTAQKPDKLEELQQSMARHKAEFDSMQKINDSLFAMRMKRDDSIATARYMQSNTNNLLNYMRENERKKKQAMWMRLGFGVLMLGVLIFGLLRRKKKTTVE